MSDSPSSLQPTFRIVSSRSDGELEDSDAFNDGILEVYGPPTTRPRLSDVDTDLCSSVFPDSVLQPPMLDSEEQPVLPIDNMNSQQTDARPSHLLISQSDPVLPSVTFEGHSTIPAAVPTVDSKNDGLVDDRPTSPIGLGSSGGFRQIIHDKDAKIPVLVDVDHQLSRVTADLTDDEQFEKLDSQIWKDGVLFFIVRWKTDETSCLPFSRLKLVFSKETANYVLKHKLGCADRRYLGGRYTRWAHQFTRQYTKVVRRLLRGYHYRGNAATPAIRVAERLPEGTRLIRRVTREDSKPSVSRKRKKKGRLCCPVEIKYRLSVPRNVRHALELDREAGNTFWADAIRKESASLLALDCFEFHDPGYKPSSEFQWTKLSMIFEVKQDGRRKARLVAGGHMVDPMGISSQSTVVKGISVRLLYLIAHRDQLPILCGDIGNAFTTADCLEKIYSRAGPEFEDREGSIMIFKKAL